MMLKCWNTKHIFKTAIRPPYITFVNYHVMNVWTDRQKYRQIDRLLTKFTDCVYVGRTQARSNHACCAIPQIPGVSTCLP